MSIKCISLLEEATLNDYQLIIVENGDMPTHHDSGVAAYVYTREINHFAKNVNIGLQFARGEYVVVLSNDVFVPFGWDDFLLRVFKKKPNCGVATLLSSEFNEPEQDIIEEGYFGAIWMAKKEVIDKVGLLDERFKNSFDDADYWVRVKQAGYGLYVNKGHIVEHLVKATANKNPKHHKLYEENRRLFNEKHKDCGLEIFERLR